MKTKKTKRRFIPVKELDELVLTHYLGIMTIELVDGGTVRKRAFKKPN